MPYPEILVCSLGVFDKQGMVQASLAQPAALPARHPQPRLQETTLVVQCQQSSLICSLWSKLQYCLQAGPLRQCGLQTGTGPARQDVLQQGERLLAVEGGADQRAEQRQRQATPASVGLGHSTVLTE